MVGNFLVMIKPGAYLVRFEGSETVCTTAPSAAEHYSYRVADRVVYTLRTQGFNESLVVTIDGLPATPQSILDARAPADEFTVKFDGYFFAGRDRLGSPLGSQDQRNAKSMSGAAANEVSVRLKKMKFKKVEIIDFATMENNLENELRQVWGSGLEPTPEAIRIEK
jgi:hypothetical protein